MSVLHEIGEQYVSELRRLWPTVHAIQTNALKLVGSRAVNGHGNDIDIVLESGDLVNTADMLFDAGWEVTGAEVYRGVDSDGWFSAKYGYWNLLVSEPETAQLWYTSTQVCIEVREMLGRDLTRDERVKLHRVVFGDE